MSIFIIAEIGINHNGSVEIAKQLIDVAKDAGADAVKFQKRTIDLVYTNEMLDSPRQSPWGTTQRAQKEGLEFGMKEYKEIDAYCKEKGIEWFASAWDLESKKFLRQFDCKYNKIASAMIVYEDLLKKVASEKKHTFISTGMTEVKQIDRAVEIFKKAGCPFELMHCVSTYPMEDEDANLNRIKTLRDRYKCRHITLDRAMYGSDQAASVEPNGLRQLIGAVRKIEKAMGDGNMTMNSKEIPIAKKLRSHIPFESHK